MKVSLRKTDYYINERVKIQLELQRNYRLKEWDSLFIVCGKVGVGKTTIVQQLAHYSHPLNKNILDDYAFNMKQMLHLMDNKEKSNVIMDESIYLMSSNHMKAENKQLKTKLVQCRSRSLIMWFNIPDFWLLDRAVVERACGMIYVFVKNPHTEKERGYYRYYPESLVLKLYDWGKKTDKRYYLQYPESISATFPNHWIINKPDYERLKRLHTSESEVQGVFCSNCGSKTVRYMKDKGLKCHKCGFLDEEYSPGYVSAPESRANPVSSGLNPVKNL